MLLELDVLVVLKTAILIELVDVIVVLKIKLLVDDVVLVVVVTIGILYAATVAVPWNRGPVPAYACLK